MKAIFFVGQGPTARCVGNLLTHGYAFEVNPNGIPRKLLSATTENEFVKRVEAHLRTVKRRGVCPAGPAKWEEASNYDNVICFFDEKVWRTSGYSGRRWVDVDLKEHPLHLAPAHPVGRKGQVLSVEVRCGNCGFKLVVAVKSEKSSIKHLIIDEGYTYSSTQGWLCPDCKLPEPVAQPEEKVS